MLNKRHITNNGQKNNRQNKSVMTDTEYAQRKYNKKGGAKNNQYGKNSVNSDRNSKSPYAKSRMMKFFLDKMKSEDEQSDSAGKPAKDMVMGEAAAKAKTAVTMAAIGLLLMLLLITVIIVPVTAVVAAIYNSPFAIFFPPLESGDTVMTVTSQYTNEFNRDVNTLVSDHTGCDMGMKVFTDYEGTSAEPDNYYDIMSVYMVRYGVGDTAVIMNGTSKSRLKEIVDDMCSYTTYTGTETITESDGAATDKSCFYVEVTLKTYRDMIDEYHLSAEEAELLEEMMSPESMAMLHSEGGESLSVLSDEEMNYILSGISDTDAKNAVKFALQKVGYPYSQEQRDSGNYYDCSSLVYYAWKSAGIDISNAGANTAAAEAEGLAGSGKTVAYEEMKPGDLIFYSFCHNGRYGNISHVAMYAGNGKVVEAKSEEYGVVYGDMYGIPNIVCICRP